VPRERATAAERVLKTYDAPSSQLLTEFSAVTDIVKYGAYLAVDFMGNIAAYKVADHTTQSADATGRV
jgi:hypothetical protein